MARKEPERAAHAGLDNVKKESRRPEAAAQRGKALLTCQMRRLVLCCVVGIPWLGAHAGRCDQLRDFVVWYPLGAIEDGHSPVDHVECQVFGSAHFRPDNPVQDRHLFGAIEPGDLKAPSARRRWRRGRDVLAGVATGVASWVRMLLITRMAVIVAVAVGRHGLTSGFIDSTLT